MSFKKDKFKGIPKKFPSGKVIPDKIRKKIFMQLQKFK